MVTHPHMHCTLWMCMLLRLSNRASFAAMENSFSKIRKHSFRSDNQKQQKISWKYDGAYFELCTNVSELVSDHILIFCFSNWTGPIRVYAQHCHACRSEKLWASSLQGWIWNYWSVLSLLLRSFCRGNIICCIAIDWRHNCKRLHYLIIYITKRCQELIIY